ncbi:unnamed protein product [Nesidiocoris tenuis]|uniref:LIM zinc-binding domain-containing protein n=1 Tax=Nesidiocoris tenuis TaxID=355587 RepID=A0A6H5H0V6_9HEMI|nr:unnamed protein product [Nesidiocoris tenuis]
MSKDWHSGHFCCWQCDESLTGQRYVLRDDHPYCIKCYESVFANTCDECNKTIGIDSKDLSYKDKHWHEACFFCNKCRVSLVDKQFGSKADKIYCGNCYDAQFASRCDGCGQIFRAGEQREKSRGEKFQKFFCLVKSAAGKNGAAGLRDEVPQGAGTGGGLDPRGEQLSSGSSSTDSWRFLVFPPMRWKRPHSSRQVLFVYWLVNKSSPAELEMEEERVKMHEKVSRLPGFSQL